MSLRSLRSAIGLRSASALCRVPIFAFAFFLAGCVGLYDDISALVDESRCNLRVGILSDTHLDPPHSDKAFLKALRYFAERGVDAVVIAGDVTRNGALAQRRSTKQLFGKVFPGESPVALVVVTGESDNEKVYEELTGRTFAPAFSQEVRGYTFVGANWKDIAGVDAWALKPLLAGIGKDKPFFYIQNIVPYATCCAETARRGVIDGGKVSYMLSKFPNAVAICGRSHAPLTDESAFWRGDFACVNAGSFSYSKMRGEDGAAHTGVSHGLVMSVYDSSVVFERIDFSHERKTHGQVAYEKLGADWKIELPAVAGPRPETPAPQFWNDTRLMVFPSEKNVSVRFPPVLAKHTGARAFSYEVSVEGADGRRISKAVSSPACCWSEDHETQPISCRFLREELPKGKVRFEVAPLDAFGKRGRAIKDEVTL